MSLPVAILAGGLATRLGPLAQDRPKALMDIGGSPFAAHQIQLFRRQGLTDLVFCVGHLGEQIVQALGDGSRFGVSCRYSFDGPGAQGTGGAVRQALPLLGEAFFVAYGDSYMPCDYRAVERAFLASGQDGLMTVLRNGDRWDKSNVLFRNGRILRYDKHAPSPDMEHIDYGVGMFRAGVFREGPPDGFLDLADVYARLSAEGRLAAFEVHERFYEIGSPQSLEEARCFLTAKEA